MDAFTELDAIASPVMRQNIDTDIVIPIHRLRDVAQAELGPYAFEPLRYLPDGSDNPEFPLNKPAYKGAEILVADNNFACGSSREGAVWALAGMGVKAVIASSYGDIFYSNCFQNGILPVALPLQEVEALADEMRASPGNARITVDLENSTVVSPTGRVIPFQIDARRQHALLNGLDDIAQTMTHKDAIAAWQKSDQSARPWTWL